jgi:hypothetical protein
VNLRFYFGPFAATEKKRTENTEKIFFGVLRAFFFVAIGIALPTGLV